MLLHICSFLSQKPPEIGEVHVKSYGLSYSTFLQVPKWCSLLGTIKNCGKKLKIRVKRRVSGSLRVPINKYNNKLFVRRIGILFTLYICEGSCTIVAPPWSDAQQNPCSSEPNGWQLLYWPLDGKCYKIFQKGYPCPDSMELTPGKGGIAECQCPPGTAQSPRDAVCYKLFTKGPCDANEYFAPIAADPKRYI